ncbi:GNAT family N-acetyltransferase [Populibacterium corticicola]|uniref:GNAT family N-acetyltransferase n=1 Tax=Populibacterium corticicola TaxID=1812826 RepID=A0ABW5XBW6_9MICO
MGFSLQVLESPEQLTEFYNSVLAPSFPPTELVDLEEFVESCNNDYLHVIGAVKDDEIIAGAVGTTPTQEGVMLLLYLALQPGLRGSGVGGALLDYSIKAWRELFNPTIVMAEVEHPTYHAPSEEHGDPAKRLRFYARHGGKILDIPYFQPSIREGEPPVPALMLVTLWVAPETYVGENLIAAWPLRAALRRELVEACDPEFAPSLRVEESVAGDSVRLFEPDELDQVPVGFID